MSTPVDGEDLSTGLREPTPPRHEEDEVEAAALEVGTSQGMILAL
jgi:hypothetical protein